MKEGLAAAEAEKTARESRLAEKAALLRSKTLEAKTKAEAKPKAKGKGKSKAKAKKHEDGQAAEEVADGEEKTAAKDSSLQSRVFVPASPWLEVARITAPRALFRRVWGDRLRLGFRGRTL